MKGHSTDWKAGDWCFCEFTLQIVKEVRETGDICEVSDGHFCLSSNSLNYCCVPLSLAAKQVSDGYDYWRNRLHKEGGRLLNFPDIHRWLVNHWVETCSKIGNEEALRSRYMELEKFCMAALAAPAEAHK